MTGLSELRAEIAARREAVYEHACDLADEGKDGAERAFGRVEAYDEVLEHMDDSITVPCVCGAADMGDDSWDLDVRPDCPVHNSDTSGDQPTMAEDPF